MNQPKVTTTVSAYISRRFVWEPESGPRMPDYNREVVVTSLTVKRFDDGPTSVSWEGRVVKRDGTVGLMKRSGRSYGTTRADWMRELVDSVPTAKAVLNQ